MIKNSLGGALINYGLTLPDPTEAHDGSLFFKTGGGGEGLYLYRLISDVSPGVIGNQAGAQWNQIIALGGGLLDADTLNGLSSSAFQPVDTDLTALAGITTTGILTRTGSGTATTRTLTGSSTITVTNGNGVSGNPTFAVDQSGLSLGSIGGTLPVNRGGTGSTVIQPAGRVMYSDGTNILATLTGAAPSGSGVSLNRQVLISNGSAAPSWVNSTSLNVAYAVQAASADSATVATTALSTTAAANVTVVANSTNASQFISFYSAQSGDLPTRTDAGLTYNPSTNSLSVTGTVNSADITITDTSPTVFLIETGGTQKPGFLFLNENIFSIRTNTVGSNTTTGSTAIISTNFTTGAVTLAGDVTTTANATLGATGDLTVAGATTLNSATTVNATLNVGAFATTLGGTLTVTGASTFNGPVVINDPLSVVGAFATTLGGTLSVTSTISTSASFRAPNGLSSAPTFTFTGDPDTGMFREAANTLGFAAGSQLIFSADADGITMASTRQVLADGGSGAGAPAYSFAGDPDTGIWGSANLVAVTTGGTTRAQFDSGGLDVFGAITATGNITAFAPSDRRLKTDIRPISQALKKVKDLAGVAYTLKESGRAEIGLIAQDTAEVVPEVVREGSDGIYGIAYGNLVGLLIEAIKELDARVTDIEEALYRDAQ